MEASAWALRGNPAPRDVDSARRYLSNAAANGYLTAMAKMAELELAERRPLQAMIWAQLYGHYTLNPVAGKKIDEDKASGYFANLLHRADVAFDKKQDMTMRNDVAAFIFLHDKQIRAGMAGGEIKSESPAHSGETTRQTYAPKTGRAPGVHNDELAEFLVAFAANGHATQAWLIDAVPDFDSGSKIANIAERVRVNAIPAGADTRYGVVPILYTFRRYKIK